MLNYKQIKWIKFKSTKFCLGRDKKIMNRKNYKREIKY